MLKCIPRHTRPPLGTPVSDWRDVATGYAPALPILELNPPPSIQLSFQQLTQYPFCKSFCLIYIHLMGGGCTPLAGSTPHCKTRSTSAESTSTAATRAIRSRDSTTRYPFFFRTRFPSTPPSGPLLLHTRPPTPN